MNRRRFNRVGLAVVSAAICALAGSLPATPCNRTDGCVPQVQRESYNMKQDGRMSQGMQDGRENIEAFRRLQAAEQARSSKK